MQTLSFFTGFRVGVVNFHSSLLVSLRIMIKENTIYLKVNTEDFSETFHLDTSQSLEECQKLLIAAFKHNLSFIDFTRTFAENIRAST